MVELTQFLPFTNFEGTRLWLKEPYRSYCSYLQDALNTARIQ